MSKPTSFYVWDTNKTHLVTSTSGHRSDGYVTNEIPGSGEWNYVWNAHGEWLGWADSVFDANGLAHVVRTRKIPAAAAMPVDRTKWSFPFIGSAVANSATNASLMFPIELNSGERLLAARLKYSCGATDVIQLIVYRLEAALQNDFQLGTTATSADHSGTTQTLSVTGLSEVVSSGNDYSYIGWAVVTAFANAPSVWGLEVDYDVP